MTGTENYNNENKERTESPDGSDNSRAKARALKILGNRRYSAHEMEKRLVRKGENEETAQETVRWLESMGAVDDVDYADAIVSHYSSKGYGLKRIRDELFKRGIPRDMWDDAISAIKQEDTDAATREFLRKKLGDDSDKDDQRRALDALCRRGFCYDDARLAITSYLESVGNTMDNENVEQ